MVQYQQMEDEIMSIGKFADRLRRMRKGADISRQQMADELQMTLVSYGDFERGRRYPTVENLIKISEMLGTTPNELLGYKTMLFAEAEEYWSSVGYGVELGEGGIVKLIREVEQEEFFKTEGGKVFDYKPPKREEISFASREVFVKYTQNVMRQFEQHIRAERKAFLDRAVSRD